MWTPSVDPTVRRVGGFSFGACGAPSSKLIQTPGERQMGRRLRRMLLVLEKALSVAGLRAPADAAARSQVSVGDAVFRGAKRPKTRYSVTPERAGSGAMWVFRCVEHPTVTAHSPRLADVEPLMREAIAVAAGIPSDAVEIKVLD